MCLCICVDVINDAHMIVLKYHRCAYISSMQNISPDPDDDSSENITAYACDIRDEVIVSFRQNVNIQIASWLEFNISCCLSHIHRRNI